MKVKMSDIKCELFDQVGGELDWIFFKYENITLTIFEDGYCGFNQNGVGNLFDNEQFDEIIRVRKLFIKED